MEKKHTIVKALKSPILDLVKPRKQNNSLKRPPFKTIMIHKQQNAKRLDTCSQKIKTTNFLKERTKQKITKPFQLKEQQNERTPSC